MKVIAARGKLFALYRGASGQVNRGMYLIDVAADLSDFHDRQIAPMKIGICVMSTADLTASPNGVLAAWETQDHVFWSAFDPTRPEALSPRPVPAVSKSQKHPRLCANSSGQVLVVWAVGTGWNKGGSIAWQLFDPLGVPIPGAAGRSDDLPVWGLPAVFAKLDGGFVIFY